MSNLFQRIERMPTVCPDIARHRGEQYDTYGSLALFKISYIHELFSDQFLSAIAPDQIQWAEISGPGLLEPHVDSGLSVNLNFYFSAGKAVTKFYERTERAVGRYWPGKQMNVLYSEEDLILKDSFTAESDEVYLLNTIEIHAVELHTPVRKLIQISWKKKNYLDVLRTINEFLGKHAT